MFLYVFIQLVDIGDEPRENCILLHRESTISKFQDISEFRWHKRFQSDKECHPHVICMGGPGTGKSRLADFGLVALKSTKDEELRDLANKRSLAVHVTYNSHSGFNGVDAMIGAEASLGCRILASYFNFTLSNITYQPDIKTLTVEASVNAVVEHFRSTQTGLAPSEPVLLYVAVDDITSIVTESENWSRENGVAFLRTLFVSLGRLYSMEADSKFFLVTMVTGTIYGVVSDVLYNRPFENLAVPLLTLDESLTLTRKTLGTENVHNKLKLQLSDVGGIPRYIWFAINRVKKWKDKNLEESWDNFDWRGLRDDIELAMENRYQLNRASPVLQQILEFSLLRIPVRPSDVVNGDLTWRDLENDGRLFFSEDQHDGGRLVLVPFMFFQIIGRNNPRLRDAVDNLKHDMWASWEVFNAHYDALLLTLLSQRNVTSIAVKDYYKGADFGSNVKDLELSIPKLKSPSGHVVITKADVRFLETGGWSNPDPKTVYLNAGGSKWDGYFFHPERQVNGRRTPNVLRCLHMKHTTGNTPLDVESVVMDIKNDEIKLISKFPPSKNMKAVHVILSNRNLKKRIESLGDNFVVVARNNLTGFYSQTFADRVLIMLQSSE